MNKLAVIVLLICSFSLTACSNNPIYGEDGLLRDKKQDYERATTIPRLDVPEHLDSNSIHDLLQVPEVGSVAIKQEGDFEVPRPAFFYAEAGNDAVNLARDGKDKYILVNEAPEDVWQKLLEFWSYNHMELAITDPQQGLMETTWIVDEAEDQGFFTELMQSVTFQSGEGDQMDKLRVRLARDEDPDKTAIRMQHVRVSAEEENPVADWSQQRSDVSYKSEMMYAMLHYLSKATETTTAVALQRRESQPTMSSLLGRDADGNPVLKVIGSVDEVWNSLGEAMEQADMDVGSSNRDIGKYYMTYTSSTPFDDEGSSGGFWGFIEWLHSDRADEEFTIDTGFLTGDDEDAEGTIYSAEAPGTDPDDLSQKEGYKLWLGGRVIYVFESGDGNTNMNEETGELEYTGQYQVKLNRRSSGVYVTVLTDQAQPAPAVIAEEILWVIKENLDS